MEKNTIPSTLTFYFILSSDINYGEGLAKNENSRGSTRFSIVPPLESQDIKWNNP